jgi:hypothetical protein
MAVPRPDPTIHPFPTDLSDLFVYVNLVTKGAPKSFKTLPPCLQVLDNPLLCWYKY